LMNVVEGLKGFARAPRNILAALHVSFMVWFLQRTVVWS
jgi:hypothetical protein